MGGFYIDVPLDYLIGLGYVGFYLEINVSDTAF